MNRRIKALAGLGVGLALVVPANLATVGTASAAKAHPAKYNEYYSSFKLGARPIPMHDGRWAPQGLTNWGENKLIIGYYDISKPYGKRYWSRIAIVDRASGKRLKTFKLHTQRHVSGLATTKGYLWVVVDSRMIRYPTSRLGAKDGTMIRANGEFKIKGKGSYAFGDGESIWTGTCTDSKEKTTKMYQYSVKHGKLSKSPRITIPAPGQVQGVAVTAKKIIWSTSWGTADSTLIVWPKNKHYAFKRKLGNKIIAPPRSEGLAIANNHLHLVYESSAKVYQKTTKKRKATKPVIRSIHHGTVPPL